MFQQQHHQSNNITAILSENKHFLYEKECSNVCLENKRLFEYHLFTSWHVLKSHVY